MGRKYMILILLSFLVVAIDQVAKIYIHTSFELGDTVSVINNFFNITYVRNMGAAFGIFSDSQETFRHVFFLSIPVVAVAVIIFFIYGLPEDELAQIISLSLISGGAIGNYIDRIRYGYVIDFLDVHIKNIYSWPVFNIADSAIVVGVSVLSILMVLEYFEEKKSKASLARD